MPEPHRAYTQAYGSPGWPRGPDLSWRNLRTAGVAWGALRVYRGFVGTAWVCLRESRERERERECVRECVREREIYIYINMYVKIYVDMGPSQSPLNEAETKIA